MYRTTAGVSLDIVITRLGQLADDDDLQGGPWLKAIVDTFLITPAIWPLDDQLFEMLLAWAGVDLATAEGTAAAVAVSRYLEGTGICPLTCSHPVDDLSPRCALVRSGEAPDAYEAGLTYAGTEPRSTWLRVRTQLTSAYRRARVDEADDETCDDPTDEEYPDAA